VRSPHQERRRRPGRARPLGQSPAARRRSPPHSLPPPAPGQCSIPGGLGIQGRCRIWAEPKPGLVFDEAFVDHRQPAQRLLESHCLAHRPPLAFGYQSTSWWGGFHPPDGVKMTVTLRSPSSPDRGDCLAVCGGPASRPGSCPVRPPGRCPARPGPVHGPQPERCAVRGAGQCLDAGRSTSGVYGRMTSIGWPRFGSNSASRGSRAGVCQLGPPWWLGSSLRLARWSCGPACATAEPRPPPAHPSSRRGRSGRPARR
jgi:hypothetical protein